MPPAIAEPAPASHRIPAVERAAAILDSLAQESPAQIGALSAALKIPRSTVYRILNSLAPRGLVVRGADNGWRLGPAVLRLARAVPAGADLVGIARPAMETLAARLGATVKLSVPEGDQALVVAVCEAPQSYSVTTQVGRRFPLHAGAASKVLAAFAPAALRERLLDGPLAAHTPTTITDPAILAEVLGRVARQGWAEDQAEFVAGVAAVAAPVFDATGACLAAVSVPHLVGEPAARRAALRAGVQACAAAITRRLGGTPG